MEPFASINEFETAFSETRERSIIPAGNMGSFRVIQPSAELMAPIARERSALFELMKLDFDDPEDVLLVDEKTRNEKPQSQWPNHSTDKLGDEEYSAWFVNCARIICASVVDANDNLLFEGREALVRSWDGDLIGSVTADLMKFINGEGDGGSDAGNSSADTS